MVIVERSPNEFCCSDTTDLLVKPRAMGYGSVMSKDARCRARQYYHQHGRLLEADLATLRRNDRAVLVWLPQLVAMMIPVAASRLQDGLDLAVSPHDADAWYVHLLVGDFRCACHLAQGLEPLPLLCFQRGSRNADIHICDWSRFISGNTQQR